MSTALTEEDLDRLPADAEVVTYIGSIWRKLATGGWWNEATFVVRSAAWVAAAGATPYTKETNP